MKALQAGILSSSIDLEAFNALAAKVSGTSPYNESCFLNYMRSGPTSDVEVILCDFFHSKDRAREYYLRKCKFYISCPLH